MTNGAQVSDLQTTTIEARLTFVAQLIPEAGQLAARHFAHRETHARVEGSQADNAVPSVDQRTLLSG
jgi:hypothetical protein